MRRLFLANIFNDYFNDITKNLNLNSWVPGSYTSFPKDPVKDDISKFEKHPSIIKIKEVFVESSSFEFIEADTVKLSLFINWLRH